MNIMFRIIAVLCVLLLPTLATAQGAGQLGPAQVWGNPTLTTAPAQPMYPNSMSPQTSISGGTVPAADAGFILFNSGANQTNTLPSVSANTSKIFWFKNQQTGIWTINTGAANGAIFGDWGFNLSYVLLFNIGDVVGIFSDGGNWHIINGTAPQMGSQNSKVTVQRLSNPSFEVSRWAAFGSGGQLLCDSAVTATTTSCLTEAGQAAMPYVLNAAPTGFDLEIVGGMDPSPPSNGWFSGGPVLISMSTGWTTPAFQGGRIWGYGLTFTCSIIIDSLEFGSLEFFGSQVSPCGGVDGRNGLIINPTHGSPLDHITAVGPSTIFFQSPLGGLKITGGMLQNSNLHIGEQNVAAVFTTGCVYDSDTATTANIFLNRIQIDFLHGFNTAGMTAMCVGHAFESGGLVNGFNKYDIGMGPDSAGIAVNGVDTWGHDDRWQIHANNMGSANYIIKFEAGSCGNVVDIVTFGGTPTTPVIDSGGCSTARANSWKVNGIPFFPPGTVSASPVPGIGFSGFPTSGWATSSGNLAGILAGALALDITTTGTRLPAGQVLGWSSATSNTGGFDTAFSRDSAGVVDLGNGTQGDKSGTLNAATGNYATLTTSGSGSAKQIPPPFPGYQSGVYITGRTFNAINTTSLALAANVLYATPLIMDAPATWTSLNIDVIATGTATLCRLGIFNNDYTDGGPGTLLLDAGTVSVSGTGVASATISQALGPLFYYSVLVCNGTVSIASVAVGTNNDNSYMQSMGVTTWGTGDIQISKTFTFGVLSGASPFGAVTRATASIPIMAVKK